MSNQYRPLLPVNPEGLDDVVASLLEYNGQGGEGGSGNGQPLNVTAKINREVYIKVPQKGVLISKRELYKGAQFKYDWEKTIFTLQDNGLIMPSPSVFMTHFVNVKNAAEGNCTLNDGNGKVISRSEARELWDYMSSTNRGNMPVCWTWLDAFFKKDGNNPIYVETDHRVVKQGTKKVLQGKRVSLDSHLSSQGWAELSFNAQGLANKASAQNSYVQGANVYFWPPVNSYVARFGADSVRAGLDCYGNPAVVDGRLGVFACAEGAGAQK